MEESASDSTDSGGGPSEPSPGRVTPALTLDPTDGRYHCCEPGCSSSFTLWQNLVRHLKSHARRVYRCTQCHESFHKRRQLTCHEYKHTGIKPFACDKCDKRFALPSRLKAHAKIHAGYPCQVQGCDRVYYKWSELRRHLSAHMEPVTCTQPGCMKSFRFAYQLRAHASVHSGDVKCPEPGCDVVIARRRLPKHIRQVHPRQSDAKLTTSPRYPTDSPCHLCSSVFRQRQHLRRHLRDVHGEEGASNRRRTASDESETMSDNDSAASMTLEHEPMCRSDYNTAASRKSPIASENGPTTSDECINGPENSPIMSNADPSTSENDASTIASTASSNAQNALVSDASTSVLSTTVSKSGQTASVNDASTSKNVASTSESGPSASKSGQSASKNGPSASKSGQSASKSGPSASENGPNASKCGPSASKSGTSASKTVRSYSCGYCDRKFSKPYKLEYHLNVHLGLKPFECTFEGCAKAYASPQACQTHMLECHGLQNSQLRNAALLAELPGAMQELDKPDVGTRQTA